MFQLTEQDQRFLLRIARDSVQSYLVNEPPGLPEVPAGVLTEPRGVFVSIHKDGELRGCIGNIHPSGALYRTAAECAVAAAVGDPRFMPLTLGEMPDVEFEVSVLSSMEPVENIADIEIGKHGLLISRKNARGLLLPQVATSYGWDREQFLAETCKKAGLSSDAWKDGATIHTFSAFVFGERQSHLSATT